MYESAILNIGISYIKTKRIPIQHSEIHEEMKSCQNHYTIKKVKHYTIYFKMLRMHIKNLCSFGLFL